MSDSAISSFVTAFFFLMVIGMISLRSCLEVNSYYNRRCTDVCGEKNLLVRDDGVCVCQNGNSWAWQEGYTYKVGRK